LGFCKKLSVFLFSEKAQKYRKGSGKNKKEAQQRLLRFFRGLLRGFVKMLKIRLAGQAVAGPPIIARLFAFLSF
jgi:hypothetical protein